MSDTLYTNVIVLNFATIQSKSKQLNVSFFANDMLTISKLGFKKNNRKYVGLLIIYRLKGMI